MEGEDGIARAKADVGIFLNNLFSGEFGDIPTELTLEIGSEYFGTDIWRQYTNDYQDAPYELGPNNDDLAYVFGTVFAAMASEIKKTQATHPDNADQSVDINIAIQTGRFHATDEDGVYGGNAQDNADFIRAFRNENALAAVDAIIWHKYMTNFYTGKTGSEDVSSIAAEWNAAIGDGNIDVIAGFASPTLSSILKPEHYEPSLGYILQMTAGLIAEGVDYATIFGFGSEKFGSLAFKNQAYIGGELWGMMAESLPGKRLVSDFRNNQPSIEGNAPLLSDALNHYVFEDDEEVVVFLSAFDFAGAGDNLGQSLDYQLKFDQAFTGGEVSYLRTLSKSEHLRDGQPIGMTGQISTRPIEVTSGPAGSSIDISFEADYEIIRLTLLKSQVQPGQIGTGLIIGSAENDRLISSEDDDCIFGLDGDDLIDAGAGNDTVSGGQNDDTMTGGMGDDLLVGGPEDDILHGGPGADTLIGGDGNDKLFGSFTGDQFSFHDSKLTSHDNIITEFDPDMNFITLQNAVNQGTVKQVDIDDLNFTSMAVSDLNHFTEFIEGSQSDLENDVFVIV